MTKRRTGFVPKTRAEQRLWQRLRGMTFRVAMVVMTTDTPAAKPLGTLTDGGAAVAGRRGPAGEPAGKVADLPSAMTIAVKGCPRGLLRAVTDRLRGVMAEEVEIRVVRLPDLVQGVQTSWYEVVCRGADVRLAAPLEWCRLMAGLMNRYLRCEVTLCQSYEQFLRL